MNAPRAIPAAVSGHAFFRSILVHGQDGAVQGISDGGPILRPALADPSPRDGRSFAA
ncbi:hypothetical protein [Polyangium mundeleinium]|uniref:Uncharacterized protein n=1 Tax=Polyangium mundeleinium TaxID=2995306 RepID=A0ABT5EWM0_9BACT|nr:hypothetical protein [Polyangium mundeleinium]MDC0745702.1 hypothetical protein [Polyangium mundeleinium]